MTKRSSSARRFAALVLAALALQGLYPLLLRMEGDAAVPLLILLTYGLLPLAAVLLPCWAARGNVHPLAACLPIGGLSLAFATAPPWMGLVCLLLSLVGAVAGQEWEKRRGKETEKRHAGKARKR